MRKYLLTAAAAFAISGRANAFDFRAWDNYDSCMDANAGGADAPIGSDAYEHHLNGWGYCQDRRDQDLETDRRLKALEDRERDQ